MSIASLLKAWALILPVMVANGILRELVLRPAVGERAADTISALLGIGIILVLTRYLLRPLAGRSALELVRASATLVALTVAFELLFGHYVGGKSWMALAENYFVWRGQLWPIVLATLAFTPFLWGRWSLREPRRAR